MRITFTEEKGIDAERVKGKDQKRYRGLIGDASKLSVGSKEGGGDEPHGNNEKEWEKKGR